MSAMPTLTPGLVNGLLTKAQDFCAVHGLPEVKGLIVVHEGKAVAWVPDLTSQRSFPVGAFAVDLVAQNIYVRRQGAGWDIAYTGGDR